MSTSTYLNKYGCILKNITTNTACIKYDLSETTYLELYF